jgi:oligopeptide/dipeptide ABC transporter ATP-binding protein
MTMSDPLLEVENLTVQYDTRSGPLTAVSDATFTIEEGEYFGLVGESGCGKSTIAAALIGVLDDNGRVASGRIRYRGEEIHDLSERQLSDRIRWKEISYIPQSSMNSLDPLKRISEQAVRLGEVHYDYDRQESVERIEEMFEVVGLPESRVDDYAHQFSGGMSQRATIALALFLDPALIIADEPTTALDVIMQDQIFKYLDRIREETDTGMLLITHDISLVFESCDRMAVMHGGQMAESGSVRDVYHEPRHPYSILLQRAFPDITDVEKDLETIEGAPPQSMGDVSHCTFADRCPLAVDECRAAAPALEPVADADAPGSSAGDHAAACFRTEDSPELYGSSAEPTDADAPGGDGA